MQDSDLLTIEFIKWEEYQPRKDYKSLPWFRVNSDIFDGQTYFHLKNDGIILLLFLVSYAAKDNKPKFNVSVSFLADKIKLEKKSILALIKKLQDIQILNGICTEPYGICTDSIKSVANERTNITNKHNERTERVETTLHPLIELWNNNATNLSKVLKSNQTRNKKAQELWKQCTPDEWVKIMQKINSSDFCCGKNDRGWRATFDWLLQKETYLKVLEGKYDNRSKKSGFEKQRDEHISEFEAIVAGTATE